MEGAVEAPADFDGGLGEIGNEGVHGLEAEDADEAAGGAVLGDKEGEAVAGELVGVAGDGGVGLGGGVGGGEVVHDGGVGVHGGEGGVVRGREGAEEEARGDELVGVGHWLRGGMGFG